MRPQTRWLRRAMVVTEEGASVVLGGIRRATGFTRPPVVSGYHGYGTPEKVLLRGRVLEAFVPPSWPTEEARRATLRAVAARFLTVEIGGHPVIASIGNAWTTAKADKEGHVRAEIELAAPIESGWVQATMTPDGGVSSLVEARIITPDVRFILISDLDDTVIETGVKTRMQMLATTFLTAPSLRAAVRGIPELYRDLVAATDVPDGNPVLYLSSSPWNLRSLLTSVLDTHRMPRGPMLLSDWGLTSSWTLRPPAKIHKRAALEDLTSRFPTIPFLLFGDSGEHDAAIYADFARTHPERVAAIVIRLVPGHPVGNALDGLDEIGVHAFIVEDGDDARRHLSPLGLLSR